MRNPDGESGDPNSRALMIISSRTPEGWKGRCRIFGHRFRLEPSVPNGDVTCPNCGTLVWLIDPPKISYMPLLKGVGALVGVLCIGLVAWLIGNRLGLTHADFTFLVITGLLILGPSVLFRGLGHLIVRLKHLMSTLS